MATFDRLFNYVLRDGKALIAPRGTELQLTLEFHDLPEAYWRKTQMDESELTREKSWAEVASDRRAGQDPKKIEPDETGRYCLWIELNQSDTYYTGGYFYYLPKEQIIELDHPDNRWIGHLDGIGKEHLKSILSRFYDKLPLIRLEPN